MVGGVVAVGTGVSVATDVTMTICGVGVSTGASGSQAQISSTNRNVVRMRSRLVIGQYYSPPLHFQHGVLVKQFTEEQVYLYSYQAKFSFWCRDPER